MVLRNIVVIGAVALCLSCSGDRSKQAAIAVDSGSARDTTQPPSAAVTEHAAAPAKAVMQGRIDAFFSLYASGDGGAYAKWLENNRTTEALAAAPTDMRVNMFLEDQQQWGGLQVQRIDFPTPTSAVAIAQPASGGGPAQRFLFEFQAEPPYKIGPMQISPDYDIPKVSASLAKFVDQLREETGVPAFAIGVMVDGQIVDQAVAGQRLQNSPQQVASDDTFHWGSIGKSVTGTMVGKLIEDGVFDWDTTIAQVLGDLEVRAEYRDATVSQLMNHEAGIQPYGNFTRELVEEILSQAQGDSWTDQRRAFVQHALANEPLGPPGAQHVYSNAGITIAGYMAEVVTDKAWRQLIEEHVFKPTGMTSAGFGWPATPDRLDQPRGHFGDHPDNYQARPFGQMETLISVMAPAGDVRSSVADLLRFGNFHLRGLNGQDGYLKAETIKALHTPAAGAVPWGEGQYYTFGWGHDECRNFHDQPSCQGHNGGAGTFYAEIKIIPERKMVIAYMANAAEPSEAVAPEVFANIYEHFTRQ